MTLDRERCLRALRARDPRWDGRFFTAVTSTGIYCRPICPARTPRPENVRFYPCAAAAEVNGFRPCRRCRPETAPGTPAWSGSSATVARGLGLIAEGALDREGIDALALRLGMGARQLRRLFDHHLGASPVEVAQTRRAHFARQMLDETELPIGRVAWAAGFGSVRRFQDVFRRAFGCAPGEVRRRSAAGTHAAAGGLQLGLRYRAPFDWESLLAFLAPRAIAGVERVSEGRYARVVAIAGAHGVVEVSHDPARQRLLLDLPPALAGALLNLVGRARRAFDLDADPAAIRQALAGDPRLGRLVRARPGLRVPGAWDPFEVAVRAVLGQQVSVRAASTLAARLVAAWGEPVATGRADLARRFPSPERLAEADVAGIGLPRARADALRGLARAVAHDPRLLERGASLEQGLERLRALPGIGPWTAAYLAARVLAEPDAWPAGDLVLDRLTKGADPEAWRPWRAYAALHLWTEAASAGARPAARKGRRAA